MKISTKLIMYLVAAVISVMGIYALVTVSLTRERLDDEMRKMADHIGLALSVGALHHLEDGDHQGVFEVLETISQHEDVVGAAIFDPNGQLLAASRSIMKDVEGQEQIYSHTQGIYRHETSHENPQYTYICGIENTQGHMVGSLRLVLREMSMLPYVISVRNQVLAAILALTIVLSLLVIYVSKRQIANPLTILTKGVDAIGQGELSQRIDLNNGGELAALAEAFNRMAANLEISNQKLVEEREHIQLIVDSIPEGVLVIDANGHLTAWNQTMYQQFGYALEDVLSKPLSDVLGEIDSEDFWQMVGCLLNQEMEKCEVHEVRIDTGPERFLSIIGSPFYGTDNEEWGAVLVLIDITDRVRMERQIQQSEKLAAIGQLAAGVAHEIGTPLNVISGSAEYVMMDTDPGDPRVEELKAIVSEVGRISDLVKRLMAFARQVEPKIEAIDVAEHIESVLVLLRRQMEKQNIELVVDLPEHLPPISGDRDQLQQVFLNLVMNAWQAMPDGGRLKISGEVRERDTRPTQSVSKYLKLQITDTGSGISREHIQRIFEPFFTTKEVGEGTGLGLAIAHRIVEDHDGHLNVVSEEGQGSTFEIRFPLDEGAPNHG